MRLVFALPLLLLSAPASAEPEDRLVEARLPAGKTVSLYRQAQLRSAAAARCHPEASKATACNARAAQLADRRNAERH